MYFKSYHRVRESRYSDSWLQVVDKAQMSCRVKVDNEARRRLWCQPSCKGCHTGILALLSRASFI